MKTFTDTDEARSFIKEKLKRCPFSSGAYRRCRDALEQLDQKNNVRIVIVKEKTEDPEETTDFYWQMEGKEMLVRC